MDYYERDLQTTLANEVPATTRDLLLAPTSAFTAGRMAQHMTTYTIGFGLLGRLRATDIPSAITTAVAWGDPINDNIAKVDDLLHAAYNTLLIVGVDSPWVVWLSAGGLLLLAVRKGDERRG